VRTNRLPFYPFPMKTRSREDQAAGQAEATRGELRI